MADVEVHVNSAAKTITFGGAIQNNQLSVTRGETLNFNFYFDYVPDYWYAVLVFSQYKPATGNVSHPINSNRSTNVDGGRSRGGKELVYLDRSQGATTMTVNNQSRVDGTSWKFTLVYIDIDNTHKIILTSDPCMKVGGGDCG